MSIDCQRHPTTTLDLARAVVVAPPNLTRPEEKALVMLVLEVEKRTRIRWPRQTVWPAPALPVIAVGQHSTLRALVPQLANHPATEGDPDAAEGYRLCVLGAADAPVVVVSGNDPRGVLYGVGHLLRVLRLAPGRIRLPADLDVTTAPHTPLRGHQLGYRDKTNSYCGWDLSQWEQYIRDLVVFGANAIELIPPRSDDNLDSAHFVMPPIEMMAGMSQLADDYGIDVWIWFPAMDEDYADPAMVEVALAEWGAVFERLPRIDAVFCPGGDPGRTHPKHLMPLLEKQTALLRRTHPQAQIWVSPQGFTQEWMDAFITILQDGRPAWLSGVVFGPWVHMTTAELRALLPAQYAIRNYPDITHNLSCQHPVPDWDVAYALTEGRESINPRPLDMAAIFKLEQPSTDGFLTYSEGCNDDVNKCVWSALGWDPDRSVVDILREYSRYYTGERYADVFAQGLLALERNWRGPLACNASVYTTLQQFQALERSASPHDLKNWRFQQALYRAYYDAYVRSRLLYESSLEEQAMDRLRQAVQIGSLAAVTQAKRILDLATEQPVSAAWRTRIFQLAEALFQSIHMQLSVPLYRGQEEVRGANLDGIDFALNNAPWLRARFGEIRALAGEAERLEAIQAIVAWTDPGPGGFYDDLSAPSAQSHLVPGPGYEADPTFLRSPLRQFPYRKAAQPLRLSWRTYTGSLNDAPFEMRYTGLDSDARYAVRIVYSDVEPQIPIHLEANDGIEVHPFTLKPTPRRPVAFDIPHQATRGGTLTLRWHREPGRGRAGRGCELSEVWLIKKADREGLG